MSGIVVSLRGGPADGMSMELDALPNELDIEVARTVPVSLTAAVGASEPLVSAHRLRRRVRHRYRLAQRQPPVFEWIGQAGE